LEKKLLISEEYKGNMILLVINIEDIIGYNAFDNRGRTLDLCYSDVCDLYLIS
jgi:hypothetical protein